MSEQEKYWGRTIQKGLSNTQAKCLKEISDEKMAKDAPFAVQR